MFTRTSKAQGKSGNLVSPLTFVKYSKPKSKPVTASKKSKKSNLSDKSIKNDKPNISVSDQPNTSTNTGSQKEMILSLQKLNSELIAEIQELRAELSEVKKQVPGKSSLNNKSSQDSSSQPVLVDLDESSVSEITHKPLNPVTVPHSFFSTEDLVDIENSISIKAKVRVIGTSMTRQVAEYLTTLLPEFTVSGDTFPNAKMSTIFECLISSSADYGPNDYIFIVGGTNDIPDLYPEMIDKYLESARHVFNQTNVIFCGIPYMYHKNNLNSNIFAINQYVQFQCSKFKIYFLDTNMFLSRSMFTKHGLHFNVQGKIQLAEVIEKLVIHLENYVASFFPLKYSHPFFM